MHEQGQVERLSYVVFGNSRGNVELFVVCMVSLVWNERRTLVRTVYRQSLNLLQDQVVVVLDVVW